MFHFPTFPPPTYQFSWQQPGITQARFPHSDTLGSPLASQFPEAYRRLQRPSSAHTHQGIHQTPYNTKKTINKKLKTKNVYITQNHTTNTHKTKRFTHVCYKDAHAHYATTNHHTNTTTRKQTIKACQLLAGGISDSVRMPNSPPNQHHKEHKQARKPARVPSDFLRVPNKKQTLKKQTRVVYSHPVSCNKSLERR